MNRKIESQSSPAAIGPYSQAIAAGSIVFVSGQLPIDVKTGEFAGDDIRTQTRQSLENIKAILKEEGLGMGDVCKTTVLLADIGEFGPMNEVYSEYFSDPYPARAAFQVAALPKGARVEIEAIASR